ncbi:succinate dehydrogenase hydrophobic membrane anchor subunit [Demequina sp.]|uniref:succinate dehydrogenase hydrophobic membrane anchor subunit n=1 Tax=Demequina sp. TaxID=2050685 RepID=UPI0025BF844E|nr:succinate dehydrogenase hydrophobic membrane anchor subunit [Demequina sp.]
MAAPQLSHPLPSTRKRLTPARRWWWIFQRASGVLLVVLIFTHLVVNLVLGDGVSQIDFAFVAGKWAAWYWQWIDFTMLLLAMLHGANGMSYLISDYARSKRSRVILNALLGTATAVIIVLGTLVIFTFDPCPQDADPGLLPSFCTEVGR